MSPLSHSSDKGKSSQSLRRTSSQLETRSFGPTTPVHFPAIQSPTTTVTGPREIQTKVEQPDYPGFDLLALDLFQTGNPPLSTPPSNPTLPLATPGIQRAEVSALPQRSSVVQRDATAIPGRGICTEFGDYWIVPNNTQMCYDVVGEQITETAFTQLETAWNTLKSGAGNVQISETDSKHIAHAGFKDKILLQLAKLLSKPTGRRLVVGLITGSQPITIRPTAVRGVAAASREAGSSENADGTAGVGAATTIEIDPDLKDTDVTAFDAAGHKIPAPVFIILGHELIHAQHNAAGRNRTNLSPTNVAFDNREEEETIATGPLTENNLRGEHNLGLRHGHGRLRHGQSRR